MTRRLVPRFLLLAATVGAASPVTFGSSGLRVQEAACQNGTCCGEEKSTCVIGTHAEANYYYKPHGSCSIIAH